MRNSPIDAVLLTNADVDHSLGLVLMRQREPPPLIVYANAGTRTALDWIDTIFTPFCGIEWRVLGPEHSRDFMPIGNGIALRTIDLHKKAAFQLRDKISKALVLVAPTVGELTDELRNAVNGSDVILFDGTFWSDDELRAVWPNAPAAREMDHLPIKDGSLAFLRLSPARRKIYIHMNNTNPILMPGSSERNQVEQAGIEIACDGLEIEL